MPKTDDEIALNTAKEKLFVAAEQIVDCLIPFDTDDHIDVANGVNIINQIVIRDFGVYEINSTDTQNLVPDLEDDELENFSNKASNLLDIEIENGGPISENGVALGVQLGSLFWLTQYGDEQGLDEGVSARTFKHLFRMYSNLYRTVRNEIVTIENKLEEIKRHIKGMPVSVSGALIEEGIQNQNEYADREVGEEEDLEVELDVEIKTERMLLVDEILFAAENSARSGDEGWYYDDDDGEEKRMEED